MNIRLTFRTWHLAKREKTSLRQPANYLLLCPFEGAFLVKVAFLIAKTITIAAVIATTTTITAVVS